METQAAPRTVDEYIAQFPPEVQQVLERVRQTVREAAPEAVEKISYGMPTFYLQGNLVHFAAYERHIGFYPTPTGIEAFGQELAQYQSGKGSVRFPLDQPIPYDLIRRIVLARVGENLARAEQRRRPKQA